MLKVVVVLASERVAKGEWYKNARGEMSVLKDGETVAVSESVGVQEFEKVGFGVLCVFPVSDCGR
jgi:hypothetical protein